jgi:hypothetical protein
LIDHAIWIKKVTVGVLILSNNKARRPKICTAILLVTRMVSYENGFVLISRKPYWSNAFTATGELDPRRKFCAF